MRKKTKKIIAIAGLAGSGKTTIGKIVAKKLGYKQISPTFKDLAKEQKISLEEFQKKASKDSTIDKEFDKALVKLAKSQKCVITTWLGPWVIKSNIFRVWLDASYLTRAKRLAKREGISFKQALAHIKKRDKENILRYKKVYNIDITKHDHFNLIINTNNLSANKIALLIVSEYKKFGGLSL